jgi:hypothetical protein
MKLNKIIAELNRDFFAGDVTVTNAPSGPSAVFQVASAISSLFLTKQTQVIRILNKKQRGKV